MLKATYKEREQLVGQQLVHLKAGQFITGRKKASKELKINDRTVYDYLKLLEKLQMIRINSNNKFSVVSIEKWEEYQVEELKINNNSTTSQQQTNTNKNDKNIYLYLINKYKEQIREVNFYKKIKIIREIKKTEDYQMLSVKEQDNLTKALIGGDD